MSIITCRNLKKVYKKEGITALDDVNLDVEQNTIFGYLGPNGAGKTTTIKILTGLMVPTGGTAQIAGYEVGLNSLQVRAHIGYLGQNPRYYTWMTGRELLHFTGELYGLASQENKKRSAELLEMAGLKKAGNRRIGGYSGGMLQRIGIAQALVSRPAVLFLDEPVSSLDPLGRKEVLEFICRLKDQTTVFMSTHILEDVERICDTVGIIHNGKILIKEDIGALCAKYAPPRVELGFDTEQAKEQFAVLMKNQAWAQALVLDRHPTESNTFILKPENFAAIRQQILKLIAEHDLALQKMVTSNATLEDVFVRLIGGKNE